MTTKNFVVKNGLTTGNINLYAGNSNIAANYVVANLVAPALANLGAVGNVKITGGTAGYVLATNGAGTLSWVAQSGTPAGSTNEIQYNGGSAFASSGTFTFDPAYNIGAGKLSVGYTAGGAIESDDITASVTLYSLGNANITGNVTSGNAVLGNLVTANFFSGDGGLLSNITVAAGSGITNGNSNVQVTANSNVTISVNGTSNTVVFTKTGVNVAGYLTVTGNVTGANVAGGNLVSANYISGDGSLLTSITGANVTGTVANATYAVSAGSATTAATVTTNAQPNITSVGTLTDLTISGNLTVGGATEYTNVNNLYVKDPIIEQGGLANAGALTSNDGKDRGQLLHYYSGSAIDAFMGWDNSNAEFAFGSNVTVASEVVTFNTFGNVRANYFLGNGSQLTGLPAPYTDSNVAAYLPTYTGNITSVNTLTASAVIGTSVAANSVSVVGTPLTNSAYMNGSSYVIVPGTGLLPTSGSYTIEFWMKSADTSWEIFASEVSGLAIFISSSNFYYQYSYGTGGPITVSAASILDNNWHHVALVRNSTTVTLYFDGVSKGTASDNTDYSSYNAFPYDIGYGNQSSGRYLTGYLSNFRVVNGTAVYTSAFTPPTSPLTAISGTTLLTFQNATLIDNSSLAKSLSVSGTVTYGSSVVPFSGLAGGAITTTGNVTATYFVGNGSLLTAITGANVTGTVANATYAVSAGSATTATTAETVTTAAQPNITSVGTLSSLTVTANISSGNANLGNLVTANYFTGNGSLLTAITGANVTGTVANATYSVSAGSATTAATVTANAQPNITSVGTLTTLTSGLITATSGGIKVGNIQDPSGTNTISLLSSNVSMIGNLNVGTGGTGNVTATYFIGNGSQLTGLPATYANSNVASYLPTYTGNITGNIVTLTGNVTAINANLGNLVTANYYLGTLTTNAQPNITSVGTLAGLTSTGVVDLTGASNVSLGSVSNLHIAGGSADYVLKTDGAGSLSWAAPSSGGGSSTISVTVDNFTGDGSETAFVLSVTPTTISHTVVNYNGATLLRDSYSLVGSTITFDNPPANGAYIEVTTTELQDSSSFATTGKAIAMAIVFGF